MHNTIDVPSRGFHKRTDYHSTYNPNVDKLTAYENGQKVEDGYYNPINDPDSTEGDRAAYYMQHGGAPYEKGKGYKI